MRTCRDHERHGMPATATDALLEWSSKTNGRRRAPSPVGQPYGPPLLVLHQGRRRYRSLPAWVALLLAGTGLAATVVGVVVALNAPGRVPVPSEGFSEDNQREQSAAADRGAGAAGHRGPAKSGKGGKPVHNVPPDLTYVRHLPAGNSANASTKSPVEQAREVFEAPAADSQDPPANAIDAFVRARLQAEGIEPAPLCSDAVFLRRAYLDVIGTLPTAEEARDFLKDRHPQKRRLLIERLLQRPEFADFWAMRWSDVLRVKSEFPINLWPNAVRAYHHWIRTAIREELPYDRFAWTLLTSSGSNFRTPPVNFYRAVQRKDPGTVAQAVALTFLGVRPQAWPAERWADMEVFFSRIGYKATGEWKEEIVFFDPRKPLTKTAATFPDGTPVTLAPDDDPRRVFADWLVAKQNPWFARAVANRMWAWVLGRGIVHEPDDFRPDNPPSHPELLDYLARELAAADYNLKHLLRLILNSRTYQQSSVAATQHPKAAALFASYPIRRLEAEVLIDAICQITGTAEHYSSPIPEPFTYLPHGHRAIALADASITSPFLEMFGRPSRDTGLASERDNKLTANQRLHLLNSAHIQTKIEKGPGLAGLLASSRPHGELMTQLYLTILSRYPTPAEVDAALGSPPVDIAWALINSAEFLCRH
ncbi:MAG: DUF1549 and DUF1553 domain-containing protein [Gemmataceae bacterium]|nr:DUF1549 and DUF1553 domain-containing protein [Gemmataceae bacterium]